MNISCLKYPAGFARAGRWDATFTAAMGIPKNLKNNEEDLCLLFSDSTVIRGFIVNDKNGDVLVVSNAQQNNSDDAINRTAADFSYYELYPAHPSMAWRPIHFGYTEYKDQSRKGAKCIATVDDDPESVCSALPTCLGYHGPCLVGMGAQNLTWEDQGLYVYYEKRFEHIAVIWITDNILLSAAIALAYITLFELRHLMTSMRR